MIVTSVANRNVSKLEAAEVAKFIKIVSMKS